MFGERRCGSREFVCNSPLCSAAMPKVEKKPRADVKKRPSSAAASAPKARSQPHPQESQPRPAVVMRTGLLNTKAMPQRKIKGKNMLSGLFPKSSFEEIAKRAAETAPEFLRQKVGYPLPFVGDLSCSVKGFERDLNGIGASSVVVFVWQFRFKFKAALIEGARTVKHRCRTVYYGRATPRPPRAIRAAACTARASVGLVLRRTQHSQAGFCTLRLWHMSACRVSRTS